MPPLTDAERAARSRRKKALWKDVEDEGSLIVPKTQDLLEAIAAATGHEPKALKKLEPADLGMMMYDDYLDKKGA